VFINVLKNAIEAMPSGGDIVIQLYKANEYDFQIRFIDQGCGIPEQIIENVGAPFFTGKENGTGLGIMVSQRLIENHKGQIHITSEVNRGTTVDIILPIHEREEGREK
jgi:signal transduction histidine kinase